MKWSNLFEYFQFFSDKIGIQKMGRNGPVFRPKLMLFYRAHSRPFDSKMDYTRRFLNHFSISDALRAALALYYRTVHMSISYEWNMAMFWEHLGKISLWHQIHRPAGRPGIGLKFWEIFEIPIFSEKNWKYLKFYFTSP